MPVLLYFKSRKDKGIVSTSLIGVKEVFVVSGQKVTSVTVPVTSSTFNVTLGVRPKGNGLMVSLLTKI